MTGLLRFRRFRAQPAYAARLAGGTLVSGHRLPGGGQGYGGRPILYVGRPGEWGNPHSDPRGPDHHPDRATQVQRFAAAVLRAQAAPGEPIRCADGHRRSFATWIAPLVGCHLACWCDLDRPCHADVLLAAAARWEARHG